MIAKTEVMELPGFFLTGISARTINQNGQSRKDMMALWERFEHDRVFSQIEDRISDDIYCVYTDYETDHTNYYTTVIGCKVGSLTRTPDGFTGITVPESKYRVYSLTGDVPSNMLAAWQEIWDTANDRKYTADFDRYIPDVKNFKDSEVKIYVAIK